MYIDSGMEEFKQQVTQIIACLVSVHSVYVLIYSVEISSRVFTCCSKCGILF